MDLVAPRDTPTARDLAAAVTRGERSPVELVEEALARIGEVQPELNCFTAVWAARAQAEAAEAATAVARGDDLGPLHGVPVAIKDTTPAAGHVTTLGSFAFERWVPERDAYVVTALRRAGAIIVGQTTTPEFAHSLQTDSPLWGPTRNPHDLTRTPGGSSGGSAAAVASGCVTLAEGSDMGGSVRIPASWCGIVGLKPSLGRIPMDILPGLFDTISHHGPLARNVDDTRLFLAATQGPDDADVLSIPGPLDLDGRSPGISPASASVSPSTSAAGTSTRRSPRRSSGPPPRWPAPAPWSNGSILASPPTTRPPGDGCGRCSWPPTTATSWRRSASRWTRTSAA